MGSTNFTYTGGWQHWNVPDKVDSVHIELHGAGSGAREGGLVEGDLNVKSTAQVWVYVGQGGKVNSGTSGGGQADGGGGAGGDGQAGFNGGDGGGGATSVRRGSSSGTLVAVAGGAGGHCADQDGAASPGTSGSGSGGLGGGNVGGSGARGNAGTNATSNATGGTQSATGQGGTSSSGTQFAGNDGGSGVLARGGKGGEANSGTRSHGGGGGGGGYHPGGGGVASSVGYAPGGGGGGGSNYNDGLTGTSGGQGIGGTGNGNCLLTWRDPAAANQEPNAPSDLKLGPNSDSMTSESTGMAIHKNGGDITVAATVTDPDNKDQVRIVVVRSRDDFVNSSEFRGNLVDNGKRSTATLTGCLPNTHYRLHVFAEDEHGKRSLNYNGADFWTNRPPDPPVLTAPADNVQVNAIDPILFEWNFTDPDQPGDSQTRFQIRWHVVNADFTVGDWQGPDPVSRDDDFWQSQGAQTFKSDTFYEWTVRTADRFGVWGTWAVGRSFYSAGTSAPPVLLSPIGRASIDGSKPVTLAWRFKDPDPGDTQSRADVRWRPVPDDPDDETMLWFTATGDTTTPGKAGQWTFPPGTFQTVNDPSANSYVTDPRAKNPTTVRGLEYEWQVRTYDTLGGGATPSDWSESGYFWSVPTYGQAGGVVVPDIAADQPVLGCGQYRVFVFSRGGERMYGEITPVASLQWGRKRDDISNCLLTTSGWGDDCGQLLTNLRSWVHEIVVFRDGVRVWEGPITRLEYGTDYVSVEAKDVMIYVYRRIMRQGYNDSYKIVNNQQVGLPSVVYRASQIVLNALGPDDPNVLPYLTTIQFDDDAHESRVVPNYSRTAWEEIDDLAATAGLDYTTTGRRILLWGTHRPIGRLPEMRDGDFSDPPVVSEYGMQLADYFAVTNNSGVWGEAYPHGRELDSRGKRVQGGNPWEFYGRVEQLASAYGESAAAPADVLTPSAQRALSDTMHDQALRNIKPRYPTPVVVRVPDNTTVSPDVNVSIQQFVPGVWIPLTSTGTLRKVSQWQKLDSVDVIAAPTGEEVHVTMSPAPDQGIDPDADTAAAEEDT